MLSWAAGCSPQEPPKAAAEATAPPSFWQWLWSVGQEPGVVEILLSAAIVSMVALFWWRMTRLMRGARSRAALQDYLLGVEQALHGDLDGAHARLTSVVERDPENHFARLMLGKVLAERGQAEEAHQQHVCLRTAFHVDSAENELLLAQSLLGAGLPTEAADAAERALQRVPERVSGWDFVYRARLQGGDFEAALRAGRRLYELTPRGEPRRTLSRDLAHTLAQAGIERLRRGDGTGANAALQEARSYDDGAAAVPLLAARLQAETSGLSATVRALLNAPGSTASSALATIGPAGLPAPAEAAALPMATFAGLLTPLRHACRSCGVPLESVVAECGRCRTVAPAVMLEPRLVLGVDSPIRIMDAIEANVAHVRRLVQALLLETGPARECVRNELLLLREPAVEELLRAAFHGAGDAEDRALEVLQAMGPSIAPALFLALDTLLEQRLLPLGSRSPSAVVGRVVQGFDRSALPHMQPLFASARPEHRKILIDYFLGLGDLREFQIVLERFPPMEILHRLNKADGPVLRRFLQAVPAGHFVADSLLIETTFDRDHEVLLAVPEAKNPEVLVEVLRRRGPTRTLTKVLIDSLVDPALSAVAEQVLAGFGAKVLQHVLAAFVDAERTPDERRRLARLLANSGAAAAERLADSFGPEPMALDDELRAILASIGEPAVDALQAAYSHSGWLEKVSIGLLSRHTNRRVQVIAALRAIDAARATGVLRQLLALERDPNLRLRLQQALHEGPLTQSPDGPEGVGRPPASPSGGEHGSR